MTCTCLWAANMAAPTHLIRHADRPAMREYEYRSHCTHFTWAVHLKNYTQCLRRHSLTATCLTVQFATLNKLVGIFATAQLQLKFYNHQLATNPSLLRCHLPAWLSTPQQLTSTLSRQAFHHCKSRPTHLTTSRPTSQLRLLYYKVCALATPFSSPTLRVLWTHCNSTRAKLSSCCRNCAAAERSGWPQRSFRLRSGWFTYGGVGTCGSNLSTFGNGEGRCLGFEMKG